MAVPESRSPMNPNFMFEQPQVGESFSMGLTVRGGGYRRTKSLPSAHFRGLLSEPEYERCFSDGSLLKDESSIFRILYHDEPLVSPGARRESEWAMEQPVPWLRGLDLCVLDHCNCRMTTDRDFIICLLSRFHNCPLGTWSSENNGT